MNEIKIFNNPQFGEIRTAKNESSEPLFCLMDLCKALNLSNITEVKKRVDIDDFSSIEDVDSIGRKSNMIYVTESGMYTVILRSDSPLAKPMQKWVTSEVLPTIRKHGAYMTQSTIEKAITDPDFIIQLAQNLKEERRLKELAQKQLECQAPIVTYAKEVLSSKSEHTATTIASQFNMSAITLNRLLVKAVFLRKTRGEYSLSAKHQGKNYTVTTTFKYRSATTGDNLTSIGLRFTEAGRMKIVEIIERAKTAGVLKAVKGRLFMNDNFNIPKTA